MHKGLFQVKKYREFIRDRDKALEQIHQHAQTDISRMLHEVLVDVERTVLHLAAKGHNSPINLSALSLELEHRTLASMSVLLGDIQGRIERMRQSTYILSYLGQAEAIGQATQSSKAAPQLTKDKVFNAKAAPTLDDQKLPARIWLDLTLLREKILRAFRIGLVQELDSHELLAKIQKVFPKISIYKRPPRNLTLIREADRKRREEKKSFYFRFVDEDVWQDAVDDYKDTQLPPSRFDNEAFAQGAELDNQFQYSWELEQDLTEDFVNQVRTGEYDAAKELGIQEFVWVAVLDDRTDQCCRERHGLTTSEIRGKIETEDFDSDCDAWAPPAHFNCRCLLAPVASADEVEGPDWASFQEWLAA